MKRFFGALAIGFLFAVVLPVSYFVATRFCWYADDIQRIADAVPIQDRLLSAEAREVFEKLEGPTFAYRCSVCILGQVAPQRVGMGEWHLRNAVWSLLIRRVLSRRQLLDVYAHCLYFGDGYGIDFGARRFVGKAASRLTAEEAIRLVAVSRSPRRFADPRHRDQLEEEIRRLTARYRSQREQ